MSEKGPPNGFIPDQYTRRGIASFHYSYSSMSLRVELSFGYIFFLIRTLSLLKASYQNIVEHEVFIPIVCLTLMFYFVYLWVQELAHRLGDKYFIHPYSRTQQGEISSWMEKQYEASILLWMAALLYLINFTFAELSAVFF